MGATPNWAHCYTNPTITTAPNPNSSRWSLIQRWDFENAYVLKVRYHDCVNFEGIKIMVYRGEYKWSSELDPHFADSESSPLARFQPSDEGLEQALLMAKNL